MPCKISKILVKSGDCVKSGDRLLVLESMKMDISIEALKEGKVVDIFVNAGDIVAAKTRLIVINEEY